MEWKIALRIFHLKQMIGVPAVVVVVGGFYPGGLPFGLEISARPWRDGELIGYAYSYEQATHHRHPAIDG